MSPILIRPVREQLEHDRVIRLLQNRLRRRFEVAINPGSDETTPVRTGRLTLFPDLLLTSAGRGRKLAAIVEVETVESVNNLEAMAQWAHFGRLRVPFHLYVPVASVDMARRLCSDNQVIAAELWSYHNVGGQLRFTLVQRSPASASASRSSDDRARSARSSRGKASRRRATRPATKRPARKAAGSQKRK